VGGFPCPLLVKEKEKPKQTNLERNKRKIEKKLIQQEGERKTMVEREISCNQWEALACPHDGLVFFLLGLGWKGFFVFPSPCSQFVPPKVPERFPRCSQ
jgi:hypothetical protein